jgi:hypothetical protein
MPGSTALHTSATGEPPNPPAALADKTPMPLAAEPKPPVVAGPGPMIAPPINPAADEPPIPVADRGPEGQAQAAASTSQEPADEVAAVLTSVLDRLGAAHHRPFSRA